jgi:hypothetical protein
LNTAYQFANPDPHPNQAVNLLQSEEIVILKSLMDVLTKQIKSLE